ncbi:hypothetical protein CXG50_05005 [Pseudomonas plecoglossicida]|nr:hypothetical protein B479_16710 [Pseudomonas putida HB3267]PLU99132.1 hypothetical protein CXG52_08865 [Pseudomonas plecoglossicida]PLV11140.1 hypothetical protein CXG50_05005 [Pseudomonas plecoglossicida]
MHAKMGLAAGIRRSAPSPIPTRPPSNCAELVVVQVRRNSDTFSPRAWRGDEGARRVLVALADYPLARQART